MDDEIRREALARALREHPDLAGPNDPEALLRLNDIADGFAAQLRLEAEVAEVRRQEFAEQARLAGEQARQDRANEQARMDAERAEAELARRATERAAAEEHRQAKLASMGKTRRWLATHPGLAATAAITIVVLLAGIAIGVTQWQQNQAFQDAVRSCDLGNLDVVKADEAALTTWLDCPNAEVRQAAADTIAYEFTHPIGSVGPGGGTVFYASPTRQLWGQFLEAAPMGWSGGAADQFAPWCADDRPGYYEELATGTGIGAGGTNSSMIIKACGKDSAAGVARAYAGGGLDDWFLPSKDELMALYEQRAVVGGWAENYFWSSSQNDSSLAWLQFLRGRQSGRIKDDINRVWPVRAFGSKAPQATAGSDAAPSASSVAAPSASAASDTASCDGDSVPCEIGDVGPGGGIVFYDAGSKKKWGRYLEVAPAGWSGSADDPGAPWCADDQSGYDKALATGTGIGAGGKNTGVIIEACGNDSAAGVARAYAGGGLDDWFMPSRDELGELYVQRDLAGMSDSYRGYWSSSQLEGYADQSWYQRFDWGNVSSDRVSYAALIRPVRAF